MISRVVWLPCSVVSWKFCRDRSRGQLAIDRVASVRSIAWCDDLWWSVLWIWLAGVDVVIMACRDESYSSRPRPRPLLEKPHYVAWSSSGSLMVAFNTRHPGVLGSVIRRVLLSPSAKNDDVQHFFLLSPPHKGATYLTPRLGECLRLA